MRNLANLTSENLFSRFRRGAAFVDLYKGFLYDLADFDTCAL